jgi:hypothetical protein
LEENDCSVGHAAYEQPAAAGEPVRAVAALRLVARGRVGAAVRPAALEFETLFTSPRPFNVLVMAWLNQTTSDAVGDFATPCAFVQFDLPMYQP